MNFNREREMYVGLVTSCLKDFCDFLISKGDSVSSEEIRKHFVDLKKLFREENLEDELFEAAVEFTSNSITELNEGLSRVISQSLAGKKLKINLKQETIDLLSKVSEASEEIIAECGCGDDINFEGAETEEETGLSEETAEYVFNLMKCFRTFIIANDGKFNSTPLRNALIAKVEEGLKARGSFENTTAEKIVNSFYKILAYEHTDDIYQIIEAIKSKENTYIELDSKSVILLSIANMEQLITFGKFDDLNELGAVIAKELRLLTNANKNFDEILFYIQNREFESEQVKILLTNLINKIARR